MGKTRGIRDTTPAGLGTATAVLAALLLTSGCVSSSTLKMKVNQLENTQQELETLRDKYSTLRRDEAALRAERDELTTRLTRATDEGKVLGLKVEELETALRTNREKAQDLENRTSSLKDELKADRETLTTQLAEVMERNRRTEDENAKLLARSDRQTRLLEERQQRLEEIAAQLDARETELAGVRAKLTEQERRLGSMTQTYDSLVGELRDEIRAGQIEVTRMQDRLTVNVLDRILFSSGSAEVNEQGLDVLKRMAGILKSVKDRAIRVEGHTDNVGISPRLKDTFPSNWELSTARATTVVRALQKAGVPPELLSAAGFSRYHPVAPNDTEASRARNRRIEIVLVPLPPSPADTAEKKAPAAKR